MDKVVVAEATGLLTVPADYPDGVRIIVRRVRSHPGVQLDAFQERNGYHYTVPLLPPPAGARTQHVATTRTPIEIYSGHLYISRARLPTITRDGRRGSHWPER